MSFLSWVYRGISWSVKPNKKKTRGVGGSGSSSWDWEDDYWDDTPTIPRQSYTTKPVSKRKTPVEKRKTPVAKRRIPVAPVNKISTKRAGSLLTAAQRRVLLGKKKATSGTTPASTKKPRRAVIRTRKAKLASAQQDVERFLQFISVLHKELEALKLGNILVIYSIKGVINIGNGSVGSQNANGKPHNLLEMTLSSKTIVMKVKALSWRGYRTHWDRDRTQGRGIPIAILKARGAV